jgi:tRNA C32,U32 (ribose-2'-O)-methylase TrmJ
MADLTVETIKLVNPHYTDKMAEAHLAAHQAAEPLRAMIPADARVQARLNQAISSVVSIIAVSAR